MINTEIEIHLWTSAELDEIPLDADGREQFQTVREVRNNSVSDRSIKDDVCDFEEMGDANKINQKNLFESVKNA